jgi:hypothetical protein
MVVAAAHWLQPKSALSRVVDDVISSSLGKKINVKVSGPRNWGSENAQTNGA